MDSSHPFVVRYAAIKYIQIRKNGLVVIFVSSFCVLEMFIMQLVMLL